MSLSEALVALAVCAVVGVPLLTLLVQERTTTVRGHLSYMAYLAAREEVGDIRFRLAAGVDPANLAHAWVPLKNGTFDRLRGVMVGADPGIVYPAAQERIETSVELAPGAGGLVIGKVRARYTHEGRGGDTGDVEFSFGVKRPGPVAP